MKKFSKLFWVALVVAAVLACTAIGVFAAETVSTAVVYGTSTEVAENENFSVDFDFRNNNTKVECGKITLTWNSNKMTATNISKADALNGAQFGFKIEEGKAVIAWAGSNITAAEGELFTVDFANKGIANDGYATVDITVDNFGYTEGFVAKELKKDVKANTVFATGEGFSGDMPYNGTDPVEFLNGALEYAATTGLDVNVTVNSEMAFTQDATIGNAETYTEEAGTVYISATLGQDGEPVTGIKIYADVIVDFYGKVNFNNILIGNTQYKYGETPATTPEEFNSTENKIKMQDINTGGCLQFTKGMGTFGHAYNESTGYGYIDIYPDTYALKVSADGQTLETYSETYAIHLAGHVTTYTGYYYTATGNYYDSNVTVETPELIIRGNSTVTRVFGGVCYAKNNPLSGPTNIDILDGAKVSENLRGGSFNAPTHVNGVDIEINTTGSVKNFVLGHEQENVETNYNNVEYKVTIIKGTIGEATSGFCGYKAKAGTARNCNFVYDIQGGTIQSLVCTGMYTNNSMNSMAIEGEVEINISGGIFTNNVYLGSYLNYDYKTEPTNSHQVIDKLVRDIDITGGQFNARLYFGSCINAPDNSKHAGASDITITNGTFCAGVYGGSRFMGSDGEHTGETTITFQGKNGSLIDLRGSQVAGGSTFEYEYTGANGTTNCQRNYHVGNTTIYLKDIVNANTFGWTDNMSIVGTFFGGSILDGVTGSADDRHEHKGHSKIIVQRSIIGDNAKRFYAGSRLDGDYNVHSGNSTFIVDANTGYDATTGEETPGENGWARIVDYIFGGCLVNGYLEEAYAKYTDITSSKVAQLGKSAVRLIGPEDYIATDYNHALNLVAGVTCGGANHYGSWVPRLRHTYDSEVYIENTVKGYARLVAGPYHSNRPPSGEVDRVPTSRMIVNGTYDSDYDVYAGGEVNVNNKEAATYITNTALILMPKSNLARTPYIGLANMGNPASLTQQGDQLVEVHSGSAEFGDSVYSGVSDSSTLVGEKCVKLVGEFEDQQYNDNKYFIYTNYQVDYYDLTQATGCPVIEYYKSGSSNERYYSTIFERIMGGTSPDKYIKFVEAGATTSNYTEIKVRPGMKFADLLAIEGLMFHTDYSLTGYYPKVLDYDLFTKFDYASESPNAFEFYLAKEDGTAGEKIETVPADRNQKIVVKSGVVEQGVVYSKASLLSFEGVEVNGTVTNAASDVTVQLIRDGETEAAFEKTVTPGDDGTATYAIDFVTAGTYTLKVTSAGRVPYTKEITVAAAAVTENVELVKPVLDVKFGHNVSFGNSFSLVYAVPVEMLEGYSNIQLVVEKDIYDEKISNSVIVGTEVTTLSPTSNNYDAGGKICYRFEYTGLYARMLSDGIRAILKAEKDGIVYESAVDEYNLKTYAYNQLDKSNSNTFKRLLVDVLNYCSAAQIRSEYRIDALVNADLTETHLSYSTGTYNPVTAEADKKNTLEVGKTIETFGKNITFGNSIVAMFAMDLGAYGDDLSGLVLNIQYVDKDDVPQNVNITSDKFEYREDLEMHCAYLDTLKAAELRNVMTIKVLHNGVQVSDELTYSVEAYVAKKLSSTDQQFVDLLKAMMAYSDSAVAYFSEK